MLLEDPPRPVRGLGLAEVWRVLPLEWAAFKTEHLAVHKLLSIVEVNALHNVPEI